MLRVGLTGGMGCGKSTVAALFRERGVPVIEADPLAHQLMEPGQPAYPEVLREFGREILDAKGRIARPKLAQIVFRDPARLARLNQIVHPRLLAEVDTWAAKVERSGSELAIIEAPLLLESGAAKRLDRLIVVWCTPEQQRQRLVVRGMSADEIERRLAAQLSLEEKLRLASDRIDCSGSLEYTIKQVEALLAKLRSHGSSPVEPRKPNGGAMRPRQGKVDSA